ncbi:MAG: hypothetical protein C5B43_00735 [Verrucomicrobia bacterium]|nr:MAG: hypothetical protein C5B43_00735 [Verrucomicrobiota bacterium]
MKYFLIKILILIISFNYIYSKSFEDEKILLDQKKELNSEYFRKIYLFLEEKDKDKAMMFAQKIDLKLIGLQDNLENDYIGLIKIFYQRGYTEEALELARLLFESSSIRYIRDTIRFIKLFFQDEKFEADAMELLEKVGFHSVDIYNDKIEFLANRGRGEEANILAKTLLEMWANEDSKNWNITRRKLWLAEKMHSSYFYEKILKNSKGYQFTKKDFETIKQFKELKKIEVKEERNQTITDILCRHFYVDPKLCEQYDITLEAIQEITKSIFYEVLKENERSFDILHAVALAVKNTDFYFSIDILEDGHNCKHAECSRQPQGTYNSFNENVKLQWNIIHTKKFKGIIIHEMTHKLMDILYENNAKPYSFNNIEAREAFQKAVNELEYKLNSVKIFSGRYGAFEIDRQRLYYSAIQSLLSVRRSYVENEFFCEYIARYPQSIATGTYRDNKVKNLMQPLATYWNDYIQPDIKKFIEQNSNHEGFICDESSDINYDLFSKELKALKLKTLRSKINNDYYNFRSLLNDLNKEDEKEFFDILYKEFNEELDPLTPFWKLFSKISFNFWY